MESQNTINFQRITEAIQYIGQNFQKQPTLDEVADSVHLSSHHFQRMFTEWAGVSPKKFLQYISVNYAKKLLKEEQSSLFTASHKTGLSGPGRLHDLFVNLEGMTPAEYKNGGKNLHINFSFADSPFGEVIVASTPNGICHLAFLKNKVHALDELKNQFPNAIFQQHLDSIQQNALYIFSHDWSKLSEIKLHLKGTDFQLKVWETLIKIPSGDLSTYGAIARRIDKPNASRAVGTAIGSNPVAYIIPCHRVIQSTGYFGGYRWEPNRKTAIIGWEVSHAH